MMRVTYRLSDSGIDQKIEKELDGFVQGLVRDGFLSDEINTWFEFWYRIRRLAVELKILESRRITDEVFEIADDLEEKTRQVPEEQKAYLVELSRRLRDAAEG